MSSIPLKMRTEMAADPFYKQCIRKTLFEDHDCQSDPVTGSPRDWEHALIHASNKVQEKWAIIPLCWLVHRGPMLNKEINEFIALSRSTEADRAKYPRNSWEQRLRYLTQKYQPVLDSIHARQKTELEKSSVGCVPKLRFGLMA